MTISTTTSSIRVSPRRRGNESPDRCCFCSANMRIHTVDSLQHSKRNKSYQHTEHNNQSRLQKADCSSKPCRDVTIIIVCYAQAQICQVASFFSGGDQLYRK